MQVEHVMVGSRGSYEMTRIMSKDARTKSDILGCWGTHISDFSNKTGEMEDF